MHLYNRLHNTRSYSYVIFTAIVLVCVYYVFVSSLCALIVLFITQPRFFTVTPGSNHCFWHCRVLLLQRFVPFYSHTTIQGNSPTAMLAQLCFFTCIFLLKIKKMKYWWENPIAVPYEFEMEERESQWKLIQGR